MAKRRGRPSADNQQGGTEVGSGRTLEDTALSFAEDLGRLLGTAERKANEWISQRKTVVTQLTELRDKANVLLERLGDDAPFPWKSGGQMRRRKPGRPAGTTKTTQAATVGADAGARKPGRRKFTAAQRKEAAERMRKYWAARKRAAGGRRRAGGGGGSEVGNG